MTMALVVIEEDVAVKPSGCASFFLGSLRPGSPLASSGNGKRTARQQRQGPATVPPQVCCLQTHQLACALAFPPERSFLGIYARECLRTSPLQAKALHVWQLKLLGKRASISCLRKALMISTTFRQRARQSSLHARPMCRSRTVPDALGGLHARVHRTCRATVISTFYDTKTTGISRPSFVAWL